MEILKKQSSIAEESLPVVVALLRDEYEPVRQTALQVLEVQPSISDDYLTAVLELMLCKDEEWFVKRCAVNVLMAQPSLSGEHLTAVVALLGNEEEWDRQGAMEILQAQPDLSDVHFTTLSRLLSSQRAGSPAEAVLRRYKEFYSTLFNGPFVGPLFKILLSHSFLGEWNWYMYVEDGVSYLNTSRGIITANIDDMEGFMDTVRNSRPPGFPLMAMELALA